MKNNIARKLQIKNAYLQSAFDKRFNHKKTTIMQVQQSVQDSGPSADPSFCDLEQYKKQVVMTKAKKHELKYITIAHQSFIAE
jgi:hypothetical protein